MKMTNKQNNECKQLAAKLNAALDMERSIVGIRLIRDQREYEESNAKEFNSPVNYCQMVAAASRGNAIKSDRQHIKCTGGVRALGFDHSDPKNSEGENWVKLGLYENAEISKSVRQRLSFIPEGTVGIVVQPLELFEEMPDVVLLASNPYNIMRITQGYAYRHGSANHMNAIGNQAICLECTAAPYQSGEMNVSSMCIGTRHQAGWKDTEMAMGISGDKFADTVEGVLATINSMESDEKKAQIEERMKQAGIEMEIRYSYNYYMDC